MTAPILITGAGQRIGLAFARACLDRGQPIIVTYRPSTRCRRREQCVSMRILPRMRALMTSSRP